MTIDTTTKILKATFWGLLAVGATMVVAFESNLLLPGEMSGNGIMEYYFAVTLQLLTIALLPLALRLFKFKAVAKLLLSEGGKRLLPLALLRMSMIAVPMLANGLLYYLFMSTTFGYMAIICLLCITFVYPSSERCNMETSDDEQ